MEYERIERPQRPGGGLSPAKLRSMLMGVDKKRKDLGEVDSAGTLRSQFSTIDDHRGSDFSESCKDVDVVCEFVDCSTSMTDSDMIPDHHLKDHPPFSTRTRSNEELEVDNESGLNRSAMSSAFEFQKAERGPQRVPAAPFSKPAPSKWDDAHKWIASPTSNKPKTGGQTQGVQGSRKTSLFNHGNKKTATKVVVEVPDEKLVYFEEPDTKRMNSSFAINENTAQKLVGWEAASYNQADIYGKTGQETEVFFGEPTMFSQRDTTKSVQSTSDVIPPPTTARSVSMRDMGTDMTPIASQEPSRTGTPVKVKSPMHSPTCSSPSSPKGAHQVQSHINSSNSNLDTQIAGIYETDKQKNTRREILELGLKLGKKNIASWASKEVEDAAGSSSLEPVAGELLHKSVIETRAEVWEDAEKAKYTARFGREEMKIQAWENHQKAKSEAELRKTEVDVERMRAKAQDKLMNKLAAVRHKAEEKRSAAEIRMNKQAAKTERQAEYIRKTGRIPSRFSFWRCSCCC